MFPTFQSHATFSETQKHSMSAGLPFNIQLLRHTQRLVGGVEWSCGEDKTWIQQLISYAFLFPLSLPLPTTGCCVDSCRVHCRVRIKSFATWPEPLLWVLPTYYHWLLLYGHYNIDSTYLSVSLVSPARAHNATFCSSGASTKKWARLRSVFFALFASNLRLAF